MTKKPNTNGVDPFEIPSISLAKSEAPTGSRQWMKALVREHGDTDPLKLEKRRARASALLSLVDQGFERTQVQKKAALAQIDKQIAEVTENSKLAKDAEEEQQFKNAVAQLQNMRAQADLNFQMMINQGAVNVCTLELLCQIVDSVTIRQPLENRTTGKAGVGRISAGACMDETADMANRNYRRTCKLYDILAVAHAKNPDIIKLMQEHEGVPDDIDDEDIAPVSDDDIMTAEEKGKIEKEVTG